MRSCGHAGHQHEVSYSSGNIMVQGRIGPPVWINRDDDNPSLYYASTLGREEVTLPDPSLERVLQMACNKIIEAANEQKLVDLSNQDFIEFVDDLPEQR